MVPSAQALRLGIRAVLADCRGKALPAALTAELKAMEFVASKAVEHPPVYNIFRTTERGERVVGFGQGLRKLDAQLVAMGCAELERIRSLESLKQQLVSAITAAAPRLSSGEELAVTTTLTACAGGSGADAHVLAEPFVTAAIAPSVAAITATQLPLSHEVSADPWRLTGWAMPGVHPALGIGALPPGVEEALLTSPGLLPSAPALMVEGINSNLAVLQVSEKGEPALTICLGGHNGATAQATHKGREATLRRQALGWFCSRRMSTVLGACTAQLRHADQGALEEGRWGGAWLLCKFRGVRRLRAVLLPDGTECRLRGSGLADRADTLMHDWVAAAWRADSVRVARISGQG
jgi:hypothetical protein